MQINQAVDQYLHVKRLSRSEPTYRAYRTALTAFMGLDDPAGPVDQLTEDPIAPFADYLKDLSPATERLYLQAVKGFYEYLDSQQLAKINISRVKSLITLHARRPGTPLPQFPYDDIGRILAEINKSPIDLITARDKAFLLTLGDTGLRVHEACNLRRGDINWHEGYALVIGKGNKQAVVRFTARALDAIKEYLSMRSTLDGATGRQVGSLPVFARHDRGAGKQVIQITTTTGRQIVELRVKEILGPASVGKITPHSFRHYFVTTVLRGSGNLKLAQELARHSDTQITQRYIHLSNDELDKGYRDIFERKD